MGQEQDRLEKVTMLQQMQQHLDYVLEAPPAPDTTSRLRKIPFLSRFIKDAGEMGNDVMQLSASINTFRDTSAAVATTGLQFGAISLAALDFFLIPIIYLSAFILNQKVPITLNNNARWLYSAVLLGLTLTAILVPVTAPIIALVTAGLTLGLTSFLLGKALYERYQLGKERKVLRALIGDLEEEMMRIQQDAKYLEEALLLAADNESLLVDLYQEAAVLQTRYHAQKELLTELKNKELILDEKIKKVDVKHVIDKAAGVVFAAIAVIGLVVSLFFPPVGLGILAAVSLLSLAYISIRIATPLFKSLKNWIESKHQRNPRDGEVDEQLDHKDQAQLHQALKKEDSTESILELLGGDKKAASPSMQHDLMYDDDSDTFSSENHLSDAPDTDKEEMEDIPDEGDEEGERDKEASGLSQ